MSGLRPIDAAMDAVRQAKETIRNLWAHTVSEVGTTAESENVPLFLTLCGAEARDIKLLFERNIIRSTETGGIADSDRHKVIAVERSSAAVAKLQALIPGLKIENRDIKSLIKGDKLNRYPESDEERFCRAKVINLDFNDALECEVDQGEHKFPVINMIKKFGIVHKYPSRVDWYLLLTINATINWSQGTCKIVQEFLAENFAKSSDFEESCRSLLGTNIIDQIKSDDTFNISSLSNIERQKILMAFVPKKIAREMHTDGWFLRTEHNLHYGGDNGSAPMVTWLMSFTWDPRHQATPDLVYQESLTSILQAAGSIREDGAIEPINSK